jgi:ABC-type multidrug transport system ATPase subunit
MSIRWVYWPNVGAAVLPADSQSDVLSPTSTVLETLLFAAKLRLPENVPAEFKIERAHTVLTQLGLEHVAQTRVGSSEHRGISGGEMRRVSIGIELVAAPDVLVLDEPTSGLDSVSAARLVKLLRTLTESPNRTTIIASIHQPSSALYHSFDQVILLAQGRQLYFGPGGSRPAEYFANHGRPCPAGYNVADHLLEIASAPIDGLPTGTAAVIASVDGASGTTTTTQSSNASDRPDKTSLERQSSVDKSDTPFVEKSNLMTYPPSTLLSEHGGSDGIEASRLGQSSNKESKWWPRTRCATTFLTQIEVLSGREWRNLKRYALLSHPAAFCTDA